MRVVVVGAGAVGFYLADRLAGEGQDVVVIEADEYLAHELQDRLDVLVVHGNGASMATLQEAGVAAADLLVAVTSNDGVNILACHSGKRLGVQTTVARIEDAGLRPGLDAMGVDIVIDPGEMVAKELLQLLTRSGASDFVEFAEGQLQLVGDVVSRESPMVGRSLSALRTQEDDWDWSAAILRDGVIVPARGQTMVREHDHVLVMTTRPHADRALALLGLRRRPINRVIVLGGTRLAELATEAALDAGFEVVVIDGDAGRATELAEHHFRALVIHGDPTDPAVLAEQGLDSHDAVVALSGWDEINAVGALLSKSLGAGATVARFHKISYVKHLVGSGIDAAVSSRLAAANAILQYVRRGKIFSVATFKDSDAEALEIEVAAGSLADLQTLATLELPPLSVVGGIVRDGVAFVPRGDTQLQAGDHLIVFVPREAISDVEAMCSR